MTNCIILDTILSYMTYINHIKGYLLKKNIHSLIKKIVEEGTSHACTLLHIQNNHKQKLTLQNTIEQNIQIKHNTCRHTYDILFSDFLQSKKVCNVCTSTITTGLSAQEDAVNYSQHNTQAK